MIFDSSLNNNCLQDTDLFLDQDQSSFDIFNQQYNFEPFDYAKFEGSESNQGMGDNAVTSNNVPMTTEYVSEVNIKGIPMDDFCFVCQQHTCTCFNNLDKQVSFGCFEEESAFNDNHGLIPALDEELHQNSNGIDQDAKLKIPKANPELKLDFDLRNKCLPTIWEKAMSTNSIFWANKNAITSIRESEENVESNVSTPEQDSSKAKNIKPKHESNLFLVRRACFRGFSEYYKNKFAKSNYSWQRKRGNKKKKTPMMTLIREFAENEFGSLVPNLNETQWLEFRKSLLTILFSHRYKKNDDFVEGIDFTQIRSVLYHYTTEARREFLSDPHFSFLVHHFYVRDHKNYLKSKIEEGSKLNPGELKMELAIMDEEALRTLERKSPF